VSDVGEPLPRLPFDTAPVEPSFGDDKLRPQQRILANQRAWSTTESVTAEPK